jgi:hypothetical protein
VFMNIVGTDQWVENVRVIDDGDTCSNAEHGATAQDLADRTVHIRKGVPGVAPFYWMKVPLNMIWNANTRFDFAPATAALNQVDVTDQGSIYLPVPGGILGKITAVNAWVTSAAGNHAGMPGTKPDVALIRFDPLTFDDTVVATASDPSANLAAYETPHLLQLTGLNSARGGNVEHYVRIRGEAGANALAYQFYVGSVEVLIAPQ